MRILVDMDGVLANCLGHWLGLLNRYHGTNLTVQDITDWDLHKFCPGLEKHTVYNFITQPGFFRHLEPIPYAIDTVRQLIKDGHEIVIVTASHHGHVDKREWLKAHLPEIPRKNIIFAERKELVRGDVLIDDGMHNLKAWRAENRGQAICFGAPHNATWEGTYRCTSWPQVYDLIQMFETYNERRAV